VLEARHTSAAHLSWQEIGKLALDAVLSERRGEAEALLNELQEASRRNHVASGVREVLEAAHQGRVHKLLLSTGSEFHDLLGPLYPIAEAHLEGKQDLLNAAAVETIRAGGEVHTLNSPQLAGLGPVAALLRYSAGTA
jgi:stalled ribosome rescue protein Dom34